MKLWAVEIVGSRSLEAALNALAEEGYEVFSILADVEIQGRFIVSAWKVKP